MSFRDVMKIALVDNYDSFTYNLVHYFNEQPEVDLSVVKNNQIRLEDLYAFDKIVISPGPGIPSENGDILDIINAFHGKKPILGVCLGLQAIYEALGGKLLNLSQVFHGVKSTVTIIDDSDPIFAGVQNPFLAGRYHSWVCDPAHLPKDMLITAWDESKEIMACRHTHYPTHGVQFHPESFLTPDGKKMIENFVRL